MSQRHFDDATTVVAAIPCAACGRDSDCKVWDETPLCFSCCANYGERLPTYAQIEAKYGKDADTLGIYKKFTEKWLESRRAKGAA